MTTPKTLRTAPQGDEQLDIFVPPLLDISLKDGVEFMDVALFRLSKKHTKRGEIITHELKHCTIQIAGGAHGMATIYDYDLFIMMVSALAHATDQWRKGLGEKPTRYFEPHAKEIIKFCRRPDNGQAYDRLGDILDRMQGTFFTVTTFDGERRKDERFPLLGGSEVTSYTATGKIGRVLLTIPQWVYAMIVERENPEARLPVLTIHPDFFLIKSGIARFVYRFTRKAAGNDWAKMGVAKLHQRAGGQSDLKKFRFALRDLVTENALPEYALQLVDDCLYMARREWLDAQDFHDPKNWAQSIEQAKTVRRTVKRMSQLPQFKGM